MRRSRYVARKIARRRGRFRPVSKGFVKKTIQKVIDQNNEFKYHIVTAAGATVSTAGTVVDLNSIPQGDTAITRDGNVVSLRSLQGRFYVYNTSTTRSYMVRLLLVRVLRQDNTDLDVASDEQGVLRASNIYSLRNSEGVARINYNILMDKTFIVGSLLTTSTPINDRKLIKFYKKWKKTLKCKFSDEQTSQPRTNSLYLVFLADAASATISYECKVRFTDS